MSEIMTNNPALGENTIPVENSGGFLKSVAEKNPVLKIGTEAANGDLRQISSPLNGLFGGREHIPVDKWALNFANRHKVNEVFTLRFYVGQWYEYRGDYWHELNPKDLKSDLVGFLQLEGYADDYRISEALVKDVLLNLQSNRICGLHSGHFRIPCFLSNKKDAAGWLPMKNAVINVEAAAAAVGRGEPLPPDARYVHSPELFITYGLNYDYAPDAICPRWNKYLSEVQPEAANRESLQMMSGLALVPDCRYNVSFFLYGPAGTGKSVFVNVLTALVGAENCCCIPLAKLGNRFGLAPLTTKLLNIVGELPQMPENGRSADVEGFFKSITSGDVIPVERKGIDGWDARAMARMVFATNVMPTFTDRSDGVWDRVRIIPFNQVFRGKPNQNHNLTAELLEELPGIFNWALLGLAKLRKLRTFPECPEGEVLKEEHRDSCDHERAFLAECTEAEAEAKLPSDELYQKYHKWMEDNGYRPKGASNFAQAVKTMYPKAHTKRERVESGQTTFWYNIRMVWQAPSFP